MDLPHRGNRSHPGEQLREVAGEACFEGLVEELQDAARLLSAGIAGGEHYLDEPAADGALRAEGEFSPPVPTPDAAVARHPGRKASFRSGGGTHAH